VDVIAHSMKFWRRGWRLYGWDDFAGRRGYSRCKVLDWTEEKRDLSAE